MRRPQVGTSLALGSPAFGWDSGLGVLRVLPCEEVADLLQEDGLVGLHGGFLASLLGLLHLVDRYDDEEVDGSGDDEEVDRGGDQGARKDRGAVEVDRPDVVEVWLAKDGADDRHEHFLVKCSNDGGEGARDNDADREVEDVAARDEFFEAFEHDGLSDVRGEERINMRKGCMAPSLPFRHLS